MIFPFQNVKLKSLTSFETIEGYNAGVLHSILIRKKLPYQFIIDKEFSERNVAHNLWRCTFVTERVEKQLKELYTITGNPFLSTSNRRKWEREGAI